MGRCDNEGATHHTGCECYEARRDAEIERLNKRLESEQHFIDAACHYRNLAIVLGAKPEQMLGKFDRELCECGIDPDDTSGGYHVSVNQQLDELNDVWAEVDRLREVARQVHTLADEALVGTAVGAYLRMTEIHKLTKEAP